MQTQGCSLFGFSCAPVDLQSPQTLKFTLPWGTHLNRYHWLYDKMRTLIWGHWVIGGLRGLKSYPCSYQAHATEDRQRVMSATCVYSYENWLALGKPRCTGSLRTGQIFSVRKVVFIWKLQLAECRLFSVLLIQPYRDPSISAEWRIHGSPPPFIM